MVLNSNFYLFKRITAFSPSTIKSNEAVVASALTLIPFITLILHQWFEVKSIAHSCVCQKLLQSHRYERTQYLHWEIMIIILGKISAHVYDEIRRFSKLVVSTKINILIKWLCRLKRPLEYAISSLQTFWVYQGFSQLIILSHLVTDVEQYLMLKLNLLSCHSECWLKGKWVYHYLALARKCNLTYVLAYMTCSCVNILLADDDIKFASHAVDAVSGWMVGDLILLSKYAGMHNWQV